MLAGAGVDGMVLGADLACSGWPIYERPLRGGEFEAAYVADGSLSARDPSQLKVN